jgi:manganese oxidase
VVNMLQFDLLNTFHIHGTLFEYYPSGTVTHASNFFNDILTLSEADRGIVEVEWPQPGEFMFHAHINEFTSLGWSGMFKVQ